MGKVRASLASVLAFLGLAAGAAASGSTADPRDETVTYLAGFVGSGVLLCPPDQEVAVGGACFDVEDEDRTVRVEILDLLEQPMGGLLSIRDAANRRLLSVEFCDAVGPRLLPDTAARVLVFVNDPTFNKQFCGSLAVSVEGQIVAHFNPTA